GGPNTSARVGQDFLAVRRVVEAFLAGALVARAVVVLRAGDFFAALVPVAFRAGDFLAVVFFAGDFLAVVFLAVDFLAGDFFAVLDLPASDAVAFAVRVVFLAADLAAPTGLVAAFLAPDCTAFADRLAVAVVAGTVSSLMGCRPAARRSCSCGEDDTFFHPRL
ncbi:MAG TPA: hypothetical protein VHG70_17175, partial [Nocardioidaceae bacterium]|nr:hypothetical protein [Nocardioidaceae bacterium]